jgi:hypothetical protein
MKDPERWNKKVLAHAAEVAASQGVALEPGRELTVRVAASSRATEVLVTVEGAGMHPISFFERVPKAQR